MILKISLLSVFIGMIIARVQSQALIKRGPLHWNLFKLLTQTIIFALLTGWILHQTDQIDSIRFYLYLIATGSSLAIYMTFERLIKQNIWAMMIATIAAGIVCVLFMNYKTEYTRQGSFLVGISPGAGYLIWGLIKKQWQRNEDRENAE